MTEPHADHESVYARAEREVDELLHRWASWREAYLSLRSAPTVSATASYGKSILARILEGMPGTRCPVCSGSRQRGTIRVVTPSGVERRVCPTCKGRGKVRLRPTKSTQVNPAFIRATGPSGPRWSPDDELVAVHWAVLDLDETRQGVVREHYFRNPWWSAELHAKRLKMRKSDYLAHLHAARRLIAVRLGILPRRLTSGTGNPQNPLQSGGA